LIKALFYHPSEAQTNKCFGAQEKREGIILGQAERSVTVYLLIHQECDECWEICCVSIFRLIAAVILMTSTIMTYGDSLSSNYWELRPKIKVREGGRPLSSDKEDANEESKESN